MNQSIHEGADAYEIKKVLNDCSQQSLRTPVAEAYKNAPQTPVFYHASYSPSIYTKHPHMAKERE